MRTMFAAEYTATQPEEALKDAEQKIQKVHQSLKSMKEILKEIEELNQITQAEGRTARTENMKEEILKKIECCLTLLDDCYC